MGLSTWDSDTCIKEWQLKIPHEHCVVDFYIQYAGMRARTHHPTSPRIDNILSKCWYNPIFCDGDFCLWSSLLLCPLEPGNWGEVTDNTNLTENLLFTYVSKAEQRNLGNV